MAEEIHFLLPPGCEGLVRGVKLRAAFNAASPQLVAPLLDGQSDQQRGRCRPLLHAVVHGAGVGRRRHRRLPARRRAERRLIRPAGRLLCHDRFVLVPRDRPAGARRAVWPGRAAHEHAVRVRLPRVLRRPREQLSARRGHRRPGAARSALQSRRLFGAGRAAGTRRRGVRLLRHVLPTPLPAALPRQPEALELARAPRHALRRLHRHLRSRREPRRVPHPRGGGGRPRQAARLGRPRPLPALAVGGGAHRQRLLHRPL